jgi:hypothetical protein
LAGGRRVAITDEGALRSAPGEYTLVQMATRRAFRSAALWSIPLVLAASVGCEGETSRPESDASTTIDANGSPDASTDHTNADTALDAPNIETSTVSDSGEPDAGENLDACVMPDSSVACVNTEYSNNCCQVCGLMGCGCQGGQCVANHQQ